MQTEFQSLCWWDLRNGQSPNNNNSPSLYGWRNYGDYGILSPQNDRYPTYYIFKLLTHFAQSGDAIVSASTNYYLLSVYAARHANGTLSLLIINKRLDQPLNATIQIAGFTPQTSVTIYSYGIPQDNAARTGVGSPDVATTTRNISGNPFQLQFPPFSATVVVLRSMGK